MTTQSARKDLVHSVWNAGWDRGETEAFDTLLASDYARISAPHEQRQGREEFKASVLTTREAFPDLRTTIDEIIEERDRLAIRWHSTATHTGNFLGMPPTERSIEVSGATFARFVEGAVVEEHVTWDPRQLIQALGITPLE